ncbi:hypothetical protein P7C70_g3180, partial [Phenoliferia sp. Uapishka_3]
MSTSSPTNMYPLLGLGPSSKRLDTALKTLANVPTLPTPEVKAFSDSVYFNLHPIGVSLVFHPAEGYKPKSGSTREELQDEDLALASIDIYNHEAALNAPPPTTKTQATPRAPSSLKPVFAAFPAYPIAISHPSTAEPGASLATLLVDPNTQGKDFVVALGEPDRKGGGEGSIGIWTEWTALGVMVEFASGGLQAWDKGGDAVWKTLTIFERGVSAGKEDDEE